MLKEVIESTKAFVETMPKAQRKAYGQFFTTELTARFMSELFVIDLNLPTIRIIDAGAGTGILPGQRSSKAREFHPHPLTEPCVKVSPHTALHTQLFVHRHNLGV